MEINKGSIHFNFWDELGGFVFLMLTTLGSVSLEVPIPRGKMFPAGDPLRVSLNLKLYLLAC